MKVFVITEGSYSDYHICGVALDKKRARDIVNLLTNEYSKPRIEEYDTEQFVFKNGEPYRVYIRDGEVKSCENLLDKYNTYTLIDEFAEGRVIFHKKHRELTFYGTFPDADHALKVAKEKWTEKVLQSEGFI